MDVAEGADQISVAEPEVVPEVRSTLPSPSRPQRDQINFHFHGISKKNEIKPHTFTGVIPSSLFLLATGTVLRKAAIDRGVRLATGRYGCRQINKPSNSTVSVLI